MRRVLGYLFFLAVGAAGLVSLYGRYQGVGSAAPFGSETDWLGVALLGIALLGGLGLLVVRRPRRGEDAGHGRNAHEP